MEKYYKQEIRAGDEYRLSEAKTQEKAEERDPEMWRCPQGGGVFTAPAVLGDLIIFGSSDTYLYAVDKENGSLVWKFKTGDAVMSSPVAENGMILFGSQDGFVYALEAETGRLLWKYLTGGMVWANAALYKGRIYIGSTNGYMHCFSPEGELIWKYRAGSAIYSTCSFVNDKLYFGSYDKHFYCLNTDGELVWKYYVGEWVENSPCVFADGEEIWNFSGRKRDYEGPASVCFGSYNKNFYVLDAETGTLQWMRRMDGMICWSHPTVKEGNIYFGDYSGYFNCADAAFGSLQWRVLAGGNVSVSPVISSGYIYFGSYDGNMYALSLEGKISWKFQTGAGIWSKPALVNNILYFGSMDSNFYAIDINTKKFAWKFVTGGGKPAPIESLHKLVEHIIEAKRVFSAWKPELIKPAYKDDKNLTFVAAPDHAYAAQTPYRTDSPYALQKKKKEPWER